MCKTGNTNTALFLLGCLMFGSVFLAAPTNGQTPNLPTSSKSRNTPAAEQNTTLAPKSSSQSNSVTTVKRRESLASTSASQSQPKAKPISVKTTKVSVTKTKSAATKPVPRPIKKAAASRPPTTTRRRPTCKQSALVRVRVFNQSSEEVEVWLPTQNECSERKVGSIRSPDAGQIWFKDFYIPNASIINFYMDQDDDPEDLEIVVFLCSCPNDGAEFTDYEAFEGAEITFPSDDISSEDTPVEPTSIEVASVTTLAPRITSDSASIGCRSEFQNLRTSAVTMTVNGIALTLSPNEKKTLSIPSCRLEAQISSVLTAQGSSSTKSTSINMGITSGSILRILITEDGIEFQ
jgi:hypothetical protein